MAEQERQSDILSLALSGRATFFHWPSVAERHSFIGPQWQSDFHSLAAAERHFFIGLQRQSDSHSLAVAERYSFIGHSMAERYSFISRADPAVKRTFIFCESGFNTRAHIYLL